MISARDKNMVEYGAMDTGMSRVLRVPTAMDELGKEISGVEEVLVKLEARLVSVMRSEAKGGGEILPRQSSNVPMVESLETYRTYVANLAARIESILDVLEI